MNKKTSKWFSHDSDATNDPKLIVMLSTYGMSGYGRWWRVLEMLRDSRDYKYAINTKFCYAALAKELQLTKEETKKFIDDCINEYELLVTDGEYIWSNSLLGRMQFMDEDRKKFSEMGKKGAEIKKQKKFKTDLAVANENATVASEHISLVEAPLQLPQANKTKQKETKQNDDEEESTKEEAIIATTVLPSADVSTVTPVNTVMTNNWDELSALALSDETDFVEPCKLIYGITPYQVGQLLEEFNLHLRGNCKPAKDITDYRAHFFNWMTSMHGNITKVTTPIGNYNIGQKRIPRKHIRGQ